MTIDTEMQALRRATPYETPVGYDPDYLLDMRNLKTHFFLDLGVAAAVDGISYRIKKGGVLGLVGESGCGKSVSAMSINRLIPTPPGRIVEGEIWFDGIDLRHIPMREMRKIRGNDIAVIFQEPMTSLNPVFTIGSQIIEALTLHQHMSFFEARERAIELLREVGIPSPESRVDNYPHEMSGGMKQRAMIAMALSCNPKLLIADEPTTALDVTIQAQILDIMNGLREERDMSILLITHDLGVIAEMAHEVAVMYAGRICEYASVYDLYDNPRHPYTQGLFRSVPKLSEKEFGRLATIEGTVPNPLNFPTGCRFRNRCDYSTKECGDEVPPFVEIKDGHYAACINLDKVKG